jgi:glycosyltransferase involved in cell wall biosynthesis
MSLSIIIPTYNNVNYLDELLESILNNESSYDYEVLIGIDNCEETIEYFKYRNYPSNFFFYYFVENYGPYIIKNTLAELSNYEKIFFFDSDDIMLKGLINVVCEKLNGYDCVKPKFVNFVDKDGQRVFTEGNNLYGEGVFGIRKTIFLGMNGFEGWKMAADSDFMGRIYKHKRKIHLTQNILFHRRIHDNSLTMRPDTGYKSALRGKYFSMSKHRTDFGPLPFLSKGDYQVMDNETKNISDSILTQEKNRVDTEQEIKQKKHSLLQSIFDKSPKNLDELIQKKQDRVINYEQVNRSTIVNSPKPKIVDTALKKAKLENLKKNYGRR